MKATRRKILAGIAVLALAVCDQQEANAILFSGSAAAAPGSSLLKTVTVENTSGSASPTNTHPDTFGIQVKKGDLPSGAYPILKTAGGTVIDGTYWCQSKWSDGSTKMLGCLARFPDAISGSSTADLKVYSGGSAPSASNRTLSEVYAATLLVEAVGHASSNDNLSGTWTAELQAANLIETIVYGDGPAGKVWKLTAPFKQSGSAHGQLVCSFYLMALQDGSGNLAGFRVMPCVRQPYYNVDAPSKIWRGFSSLVLKHGAGPTTFDPIANSHSAKSFTYSGGSNTFDSTAHGFTQGMAVRVSSTGTLPTGLSANTTYWVYLPFGSANQFILIDGPMTGARGQGTSDIAISGAGSGTHTVTPCDYICHFGKRFIATTSAKYVYVQGGGSVSADTTLRVKHDKTYDHATKLLPPFNTASSSVTANTSYNWSPQGIGALADYIGGTGERDDIGLISGFHTRHWYNQGATDEKVSRVIGLAMAHLSVDVKTSALAPINMSQGSYTGFPSSVAATFRWDAMGSAGNGFTVPGGGTGKTSAMFRGPDLSHQAQFVYYTYLITGEPQYYDMLMDCTNMFLFGSLTSDRNYTVGATTYYGVGPAGKDSTRTGAWCYREMVMPAVLVADTSPDGCNWRDYLRDQAAIQSTYMVAYLATLSSWAQTNGYWYPQGNTNGKASWQGGYLWWVTTFHAMALEDANALTISTHLSKWPPFVRTLTGNLWCLASYYEVSSSDNNKNGVPLIDADAEWGPWVNASNLSWTISGNQFTWSSPNWTPANGDKVMFWALARPGSNFSYNTQYYAVNVSGNNFQLSATPGGSAIVVQGNDSLTGGSWGTQACYPQFAITIIPTSPPSTGYIHGAVSDSSFGANQLGNINYALAAGITTTGLSDCATELTTRQSGVNYATSSPKYYMQTTF